MNWFRKKTTSEYIESFLRKIYRKELKRKTRELKKHYGMPSLLAKKLATFHLLQSCIATDTEERPEENKSSKELVSYLSSN